MTKMSVFRDEYLGHIHLQLETEADPLIPFNPFLSLSISGCSFIGALRVFYIDVHNGASISTRIVFPMFHVIQLD